MYRRQNEILTSACSDLFIVVCLLLRESSFTPFKSC